MGLRQPSQILGQAPDEKVKERLCIGLLLAIVVFAYGNTLVNAFTMDDIDPPFVADAIHAAQNY